MARQIQKTQDQLYDMVMIRDFLQHLRWECLIVAEEGQGDRLTINPERVETLKSYGKKHNCWGLMPVNVLDNDLGDEEQFRTALDNYRRSMALYYQHTADCISQLEAVLDQAERYHMLTPDEVQHNGPPVEHHKASDWLVSPFDLADEDGEEDI